MFNQLKKLSDQIDVRSLKNLFFAFNSLVNSSILVNKVKLIYNFFIFFWVCTDIRCTMTNLAFNNNWLFAFLNNIKAFAFKWTKRKKVVNDATISMVNFIEMMVWICHDFTQLNRKRIRLRIVSQRMEYFSVLATHLKCTSLVLWKHFSGKKKGATKWAFDWHWTDTKNLDFILNFTKIIVWRCDFKLYLRIVSYFPRFILSLFIIHFFDLVLLFVFWYMLPKIFIILILLLFFCHIVRIRWVGTEIVRRLRFFILSRLLLVL